MRSLVSCMSGQQARVCNRRQAAGGHTLSRSPFKLPSAAPIRRRATAAVVLGRGCGGARSAAGSARAATDACAEATPSNEPAAALLVPGVAYQSMVQVRRKEEKAQGLQHNLMCPANIYVLQIARGPCKLT